MVRFNSKEGYFNQGFRGLGKKNEFFTENMKLMCLDEINKLNKVLFEGNYRFVSSDFLQFTDSNSGKDLLIVDPPYILQCDMYDNDWTFEHDKKLFEMLQTTKNHFIYFNYLERDGIVNEELLKFIESNGFKYVEINNKTLSGQGRSEAVKSVKEVIVTNVQM